MKKQLAGMQVFLTVTATRIFHSAGCHFLQRDLFYPIFYAAMRAERNCTNSCRLFYKVYYPAVF